MIGKPNLCLCHIVLGPVVDSYDHGNQSHLHERRVFSQLASKEQLSSMMQINYLQFFKSLRD